jgi:formylglycine-generating enzyme required for sulfatase activity
MKNQRGGIFGCCFLFIMIALVAFQVQATPPVVSNVRASQRAGTGLVDVLYDVTDADNDHLTISAAVSLDGGATYTSAGRTFLGTGYGADILTGVNLQIVWNAGTDLDALAWSRVKVKVTADDGVWNAPAEMCYIPPGSFWMGDSFNDGASGEKPGHTVYISGFYMDKYEVTSNLWHEVREFGMGNGYTFDNPGSAKAANHPVHTINWFDMVKWCNARSEMRGRTPVYYTTSAQTTFYKTGQINLDNTCVNWAANGYRLPTEAEWEKAARGGASGRRFPWSHTDNITHVLANYYSSTSYSYDTSSTRNYHPTFGTGSTPYSSPVGYFASNGYGLYDMAGNMWEWCWDWYDGAWYSNAGATQSDTRGPGGTSSHRVLRGGAWIDYALNARCADRRYNSPSVASSLYGFRCVRGL